MTTFIYANPYNIGSLYVDIFVKNSAILDAIQKVSRVNVSHYKPSSGVYIELKDVILDDVFNTITTCIVHSNEGQNYCLIKTDKTIQEETDTNILVDNISKLSNSVLVNTVLSNTTGINGTIDVYGYLSIQSEDGNYYINCIMEYLPAMFDNRVKQLYYIYGFICQKNPDEIEKILDSMLFQWIYTTLSSRQGGISIGGFTSRDIFAQTQEVRKK